jgi:hypothetical protein
MKRTFHLCLVTLILSCFLSLGAFAAEIQVSVDGNPILFTDAAPFIDENSRTLVPLRSVAEAMDLQVVWDDASRSVSFSKSWDAETSPVAKDNDSDGVAESYPVYREVRFFIGSKEFEITQEKWNSVDPVTGQITETVSGGLVQRMDTAAIIRNNRTYAPIRYLAETFNYDVLWDESSKTVRLVPMEDFQCDYRYLQQDGLCVVLVNGSSLSSAQITTIRIAKDDGAYVSLAPGACSETQIAETISEGDTVLASGVVSYDFQAAGTYHVSVYYTATKSNGALTQGEFRFALLIPES